MPSRSAAEILSLYIDYKKIYEPWRAEALELRQLCNGDIDDMIPTPELEANEHPAVPNLEVQALDQLAMRVASTQPDVNYPTLKGDGKNAEDKARKRRQANLGWWAMNNMKRKDRKRARWLIGYSAAPVLMRPDFKRRIPQWELRDPLTTFPAPSDHLGDTIPENCIFSVERSLGWLRKMYPEKAWQISPKRINDDTPTDHLMYELIEYVDDNELVLIVTGMKRDYNDTTLRGNEVVELERIENRVGRCTAVIPTSIALDRSRGRFAGSIGLYIQQAKLQALAYTATEKGVYAERWLLDKDGQASVETPADAREGIVGVAHNASFQELVPNPQLATNQEIDRIENYRRQQGAIPNEFQGQSTSNVRTGKRGDAIMSAVVDFPIQEYQEIFADAKTEENKLGIEIDKKFFNSPKSFYVSWKNAKGTVEYTPSDLWKSDEHFVAYSYAGVDVNGLSIMGGQLMGMKSLSRKSFMEMHPAIEDVEYELDQVDLEDMDEAIKAMFLSKAQDPMANLADYARIRNIVKEGNLDLAEAILQQHEEAQERQASIGPPGAPNGPAMPGSPEAMPGMAPPGAGEEQPVAIEGPSQSMQNLTGLLAAARLQQRATPEEAALGAPR